VGGRAAGEVDHELVEEGGEVDLAGHRLPCPAVLDAALPPELIVDAGDGLDPAAGILQGGEHGGFALVLAGLEGEKARHDGEAVLDPVAHLPGEEILPGEGRAEQLLRPVALDGAAEQIGEALHEGDVRLLEHAVAAVVHLQHAEGPVPVLDQHVDRPADAVIGHELRGAEAGLGGEVVRDHRPAGLEGEARGRGEVRPNGGVADHVRLPADSGPHEQGILAPQVFERLAELGAHPLSAQDRRPLEQEVEIRAAESLHAERGQDGLLMQARLEVGRASGAVGGQFGFDARLFGTGGHGGRRRRNQSESGR